MAKKLGWRNRIVDHGEEVPDQLLANPLNWRTHPKFQQAALGAVLDEVGLVQQVIVNKRTGHLVDGHLRVTLAMRRDEPSIPVIYVDLSEEEEKKVLATFDPLGALAQTDQEILDQLLDGVNSTSSEHLEKLLNKLGTKALSPTKEIEGNKEFKVKVGQTWACGDHKMICGDCLEQAVECDVCITDPPYSIAYEEKEREPGRKRKGDAFKEAQTTPAGILGFISRLSCPMLVMTYPVWRDLQALAKAIDGWECTLCVWIKSSAAFSVHARYQKRHECVFIFSRKGKGVWNVPSNQTTVFEVDRQHSQDTHPTEKPLELWEKLVQYHSNPGQVVYDPFLGSGTTLIACELHGRKCVGVEIEPEYVSLCLSKWQKLTGKEPTLVDGPAS